ncbi:hypothetical protein Ddc_15634 [Ditylenchus destructor]|nr:hypothetical protein Ddc_15634 [Ditylenchus destructor]
MNFTLFVVVLVLIYVCPMEGMEAGTSAGKVPGCKVEEDKKNDKNLVCLDRKGKEYGYLSYSYDEGSPWLSLDSIGVGKNYRGNGVATALKRDKYGRTLLKFAEESFKCDKQARFDKVAKAMLDAVNNNKAKKSDAGAYKDTIADGGHPDKVSNAGAAPAQPQRPNGSKP